MTQATRIQNPYWHTIRDRIREVIDGPLYSVLDEEQLPYKLWFRRNDFCRVYSWAIPDPETLAFLAQWLSPRTVEMGAGTGYFAWLLAQLGVDILAYDLLPPHILTGNHYHSPRDKQTDEVIEELRDVYYPVKQGGHEVLTRHADRTLFLCWPPYAEDMADLCLAHYTGKRVVYIGEGQGGCTGDDAFFERLSQEWHEVASHKPVQWYGVHDYVVVYERGPAPEDEEDLEEIEWDTIVNVPHVRAALRRLAQKVRQEYEAGETLDGGFGMEEQEL